MSTLDKFMAAFFTAILVGIFAFGLTAMHYSHVERMTDKQIELVKLQNICIDD